MGILNLRLLHVLAFGMVALLTVWAGDVSAQSTQPRSWRPMTMFHQGLGAGQTAGAWSFGRDGRIRRAGQVVATASSDDNCDILALGSFTVLNCYPNEDTDIHSPSVLLRNGRVINPDLRRLTRSPPQSRRCDNRDCYTLQPEAVSDFLVSSDNRFLIATAFIGDVSGGLVVLDIESGRNLFVPEPHEFAPGSTRADGLRAPFQSDSSRHVQLETTFPDTIRLAAEFSCAESYAYLPPECIPKLRLIVQQFAQISLTTEGNNVTACCWDVVIDLNTFAYDFPSLRRAGWDVPVPTDANTPVRVPSPSAWSEGYLVSRPADAPMGGHLGVGGAAWKSVFRTGA